MRVGAWILGASLATLVGCLSPFSWPDERTLPQLAVSQNDSADDALEQAVNLIERGEPRSAVPHLRVYVAAFPKASQIRFQLAEVLYRSQQYGDARAEYEQLLHDRNDKTPRTQVIQCHTRLMNLAEERQDEYEEAWHRGVGLYELVTMWDSQSSTADEVMAERTLSQALEALADAARVRPHDEDLTRYRKLILARLQVSSQHSAGFLNIP